MPHSPPVKAIADIATQRAARYEKQLVSHMSRKITIEPLAYGHVFHFNDWGQCIVRPDDDGLSFEATGRGETELSRIQHVMTKHLLQFARREELKVDWTDIPGTE